MLKRPFEALPCLFNQSFHRLAYKWKLTTKMIMETLQRQSNDWEE